MKDKKNYIPKHRPIAVPWPILKLCMNLLCLLDLLYTLACTHYTSFAYCIPLLGPTATPRPAVYLWMDLQLLYNLLYSYTWTCWAPWLNSKLSMNLLRISDIALPWPTADQCMHLLHFPPNLLFTFTWTCCTSLTYYLPLHGHTEACMTYCIHMDRPIASPRHKYILALLHFPGLLYTYSGNYCTSLTYCIPMHGPNAPPWPLCTYAWTCCSLLT